MPIKIPNDLPAAATLQSENIFVMPETRAITQDIRPLEILILNLMPTKVVTETQFARLLGNTPLQVHLEFLHTRSHVATHVSAEHLFTFYKTFDEVRDRRYDGMIITGAPVEQLPFEDVEYWQELCSIMDWSRTHVHSTLHICWGAQAALYHHYGIEKVPLEKKLFGVFPHRVEYKNPILLRGFDDGAAFPPHDGPPRGHRARAGAEDPGLVGAGGRLCDLHGGRAADLPDGPRGIRPGHAAARI